jgi:hypothetical protein
MPDRIVFWHHLRDDEHSPSASMTMAEGIAIRLGL